MKDAEAIALPPLFKGVFAQVMRKISNPIEIHAVYELDHQQANHAYCTTVGQAR